MALGDVVEEPARVAQHVDASSAPDLRSMADSAEYDCHRQAVISAVGTEALVICVASSRVGLSTRTLQPFGRAGR
jgi:hypothetical protein